MMLAQQALTVQMATDNRLLLGIGLSHQIVVENMWGMSFERPAAYMREYLTALMPLLRGRDGALRGGARHHQRLCPARYRQRGGAPPVLVAALADTMLKLAGRVADGTVTWMTGTATIGDHIVPTITAAAEAAGPAGAAGRGSPARSPSPTTVRAAKERINEVFSIYPNLPSYKAMLDKEGAEAAADIGFIGDEEAVAALHLEAGGRGCDGLRGCHRRRRRGARPRLRAAQRDRPLLSRARPVSPRRLRSRAWCT